ncbi:MAG: hypothetical protein ACRC4K_10185 [Plesiomonas shigelloides]|uniref:hypothetical protein n=1 Tax=Plesiomonas TaxID=702 RepID=UPI0012E08758|nr:MULTISPECIES: hypothetical protein [Plesiomonas]
MMNETPILLVNGFKYYDNGVFRQIDKCNELISRLNASASGDSRLAAVSVSEIRDFLISVANAGNLKRENYERRGDMCQSE